MPCLPAVVELCTWTPTRSMCGGKLRLMRHKASSGKDSGPGDGSQECGSTEDYGDIGIVSASIWKKIGNLTV